MSARIYLRKNKSFGASCDGTADTGHHIIEDSGRFTVLGLDDETVIAKDATRQQAEEAITRDWRKSGQ